MKEQQEQQREIMPLSFYVDYVRNVAKGHDAFDETLIERVALEARRIGEDEDGLPRLLVFKNGDYFIYDLLGENTPRDALLVALTLRVRRGDGFPQWLREALVVEFEFIEKFDSETFLAEVFRLFPSDF